MLPPQRRHRRGHRQGHCRGRQAELAGCGGKARLICDSDKNAHGLMTIHEDYSAMWLRSLSVG